MEGKGGLKDIHYIAQKIAALFVDLFVHLYSDNTTGSFWEIVFLNLLKIIEKSANLL